MPGKTILISINSCWNFVNFRAGLLRALIAAGYDIVAAAPPDSSRAALEALGCRFVPVPLSSDGLSPLRDLRLLAAYIRLFRQERPAAYLAYTAKPNIYGSIAARFTRTPVINNVAGLGTAFIRQGWLTRLVKFLYRLAFRRSRVVFFQNPDDLALFTEAGLARRDQARLLPGSGLDVDKFTPRPAAEDGSFRFLYVGRMLADKGLRELAAAAASLHAELPHVRVQLLGPADVPNRTAIPRGEIETWVAGGAVEYLGEAADVRPFVAAADCVILPSYREGLPRSLLEGAAMARPLIATDVPGCRQIVVDGDNGLLCRARDADSLAAAMRTMVAASPEQRRAWGSAGRERVARDYDEKLVIRQYLDAIASVCASPHSELRASR